MSATATHTDSNDLDVGEAEAFAVPPPETMPEEDEFVCNEDPNDVPSDNNDDDNNNNNNNKELSSPCLSTNKKVALLLVGGCGAALALRMTRPLAPPKFSLPSLSSSPPPTTSEGLLNLLDLNHRASCGRHKCFYKARQDDSKGYLVATRTHIEELEKGWNYANCLEQTYDIKHYMLAGPFTSHLSKDMASTLNEISFSFSDEIEPPTFIKENVVVQAVTPAENPHMLIGCNKKKRHFLQSKYFDEFVQLIPNKKKFLRSLEKNVRTMFDTIRSEPALMDDFQVILHQDGTMHYLDFSDSNAAWAAGAPFNTTTYRNNINSCEKMVRPIYEKVGASKSQLKELDAYLDGLYDEVRSLVGQRLRAKNTKKKNACLHHLLEDPKNDSSSKTKTPKAYLSKS